MGFDGLRYLIRRKSLLAKVRQVIGERPIVLRFQKLGYQLHVYLFVRFKNFLKFLMNYLSLSITNGAVKTLKKTFRRPGKFARDGKTKLRPDFLQLLAKNVYPIINFAGMQIIFVTKVNGLAFVLPPRLQVGHGFLVGANYGNVCGPAWAICFNPLGNEGTVVIGQLLIDLHDQPVLAVFPRITQSAVR